MSSTIEHSAGRWGDLDGSVVESATVHTKRFRSLCIVSIVVWEQRCVANAGEATGRRLSREARKWFCGHGEVFVEWCESEQSIIKVKKWQ